MMWCKLSLKWHDFFTVVNFFLLFTVKIDQFCMKSRSKVDWKFMNSYTWNLKNFSKEAEKIVLNLLFELHLTFSHLENCVRFIKSAAFLSAKIEFQGFGKLVKFDKLPQWIQTLLNTKHLSTEQVWLTDSRECSRCGFESKIAVFWKDSWLI